MHIVWVWWPHGADTRVSLLACVSLLGCVTLDEQDCSCHIPDPITCQAVGGFCPALELPQSRGEESGTSVGSREGSLQDDSIL